MKTETPSKDRRDRGHRFHTAVPLIFSHFSSSRIYSEHQGFFCDQNISGACFEATRNYAPGTILFIRKEDGYAGAFGSDEEARNLARSTALAEVRWCVPMHQKKTMGGYKIGVRYL